MKNDRQNMILEIISQENIETQEQLLQRLQERGITSTQATISRDIKQMHLIKEPVGQGVYKYAVSGNRAKLNFAERLRTIFRESVTSIESAQNIVVVKTMPGLASAACAALDEMGVSYYAIDSYINGGEVSPTEKKIIDRYHRVSEHKRSGINVFKQIDE